MESHILPGHPRSILNRNLVAKIVVDLLEIHDSRVVVILSREQCTRELGGMRICERAKMKMLMGGPGEQPVVLVLTGFAGPIAQSKYRGRQCRPFCYLPRPAGK